MTNRTDFLKAIRLARAACVEHPDHNGPQREWIAQDAAVTGTASDALWHAIDMATAAGIPISDIETA